MKFTFFGHACFLVETGGKKLLFDPFIRPNELAHGIDIDSIDADYILLSHGHQDHMADAAHIAERTGAIIIATFELVSYFEAQGLKGHPMNTGGKWKFDFGTVKLVNAIHSSVLPDGTYGANPVGFVIWNEETCFYYTGDTALTMDMQLIPMTCPPLQLAIMSIGDNFTMGYEDAIIAATFANVDQIIGVHFDTFGYIKVDSAVAKSAFAKANKILFMPTIGETTTW